LKPVEQVLFRRLSIFVGGFTLAAAEAVAPGAELGAQAASEPLAGVEHSLVTVDANQSSETPPYRLLEPVRQYAAELLEASRETELMRARHAVFLTPRPQGIETKARLRGGARCRSISKVIFTVYY
jgi:predicted ATPase